MAIDTHFCAFHYFPKLRNEIQSWGEVSGEWGDRSSGVFIPPSGPAVPGHKLLAVPLGLADLYSLWCVITELMRMWQNLDSVIHLLNLGFQKTPGMFTAAWETGLVRSQKYGLAHNDMCASQRKMETHSIAGGRQAE